MGRFRAIFFDLDETVLKPREQNPRAEFKRRHGLEEHRLILEAITLHPALKQAQVLDGSTHRASHQQSSGRHRTGFAQIQPSFLAGADPVGLLQQALAHFGLAPKEALYIGDSEGDRQAAQTLGMPVWFLATPHNPHLQPRFAHPEELLQALLVHLE
ncbi:HAD hydrolase-like protein [Meiothermus rufus]|uniref:HAD hydrolase-like protein n=1 Tax=Meiothermus rufus TaxID=604332 RepID=UPI0003F8375D|nr:HAD hydrolase-like protein [Meiothermus rufus]